MISEAQKVFEEEIRDKKKEGYSQRARSGSRGSKSKKGMRTPYDHMTAKERKKLSGEVSVKNLFDLLLSKEEFFSYPEEKQREILTRWRDIYPNSKIMQSLEIKSQGTFNNFLEKLGVPKKRSWSRSTKEQAPKIKREKAIVGETMDNEVMIAALAPEHNNIITILDGLHLNYNGVYNADQIEKILTKLQLLISGEENEFVMSISLQEKK